MVDDPQTRTTIIPTGMTLAGHMREQDLLDALHQKQHVAADHAAAELSRAHWEFHQREHEMSQTAVEKVEHSVDRRFSQANEFREQLREQSRSFMTRNEYIAAHDPLLTRITSLETTRTANEGKDKGSAPYMAVIIAVASSVLSAIAAGAFVSAIK